MGLQDIILRRRRNPELDELADGEEAIEDGRLAHWEAFGAEAVRHVGRLSADGRDGGLHQVGVRPDLYRLPSPPPGE